LDVTESCERVIEKKKSNKVKRYLIASVKQVAHESCRPYFLLSDSAQEEICNNLQGYASPRNTELPYDAVVIGYAPSTFTYPNLNTAFRILIGEHRTRSQTPALGLRTPPIIATHRARYLAQSEVNGVSTLSLGPGPFIAALETAAGPGVETVVVGKPTRSFFEAVIASFGTDKLSSESEHRIAVIGDDVEADLSGGALELGLWRVLGTLTREDDCK